MRTLGKKVVKDGRVYTEHGVMVTDCSARGHLEVSDWTKERSANAEFFRSADDMFEIIKDAYATGGGLTEEHYVKAGELIQKFEPDFFAAQHDEVANVG